MSRLVFVCALLLAWTLSACSGVESVTRKPWKEHKNTVVLQDLTPKGDGLTEAGILLTESLDDQLSDSMLVVTPQVGQNKYFIKYKVVEFVKGNRIKRMATFGADDGSRGHLTVKVALFSAEDGMLGAWEVKSWLRGGITGGDPKHMIETAAKQIVAHLKGY